LRPSNFPSRIDAFYVGISLANGKEGIVFEDRRIKKMADGEGSGAGSFVWAIALIIIAAIVAAVIFSGGFLTQGDKKIDVEIKTPTR
jgi:hypothetical protein